MLRVLDAFTCLAAVLCMVFILFDKYPKDNYLRLIACTALLILARFIVWERTHD